MAEASASGPAEVAGAGISGAGVLSSVAGVFTVGVESPQSGDRMGCLRG
jgi:hypothetical protein